MERHVWITATQLVEGHGRNDAVSAVYEHLGKLLGDYKRADADSSVGDDLECWCEIGRAVLEIVRANEGDDTVH
jgi:hypothetical protein